MKKCGENDARTEKKLIFAQVLKVVGLNQGIQTHSMKHYLRTDDGKTIDIQW